MKSTVAEQFISEKIDIGDKEKKKKRRSSRRSKHSSVHCASEEVHNTEESDRNDNKEKYDNPPPICASLDETEVRRACNVAFNSMPSLLTNGNFEGQQASSVGISDKLLSKSCPEPRACEQSSRMNNDLCQDIGGTSQRKIFSSYWSDDAVNQALEKGEAFKAMFRVNAHNRNEAYCKIEGVPTDVLVNGTVAQNRAVEGDIVVIKLDPFSLWPKMKGFVPETDFGNIQLENENESNSIDSSNAAEKLRSIVLSFPYKRITGQVMAITEKSIRRDSVVGSLNIKQWIHYKKNEAGLDLSGDEYLQLIPVNPRFPRLILPFRDLPGSIRTRLESMDSSVEAELVAARIVDWAEGSPLPRAFITHIFGRGSELEPQINAILHQNSILDSEFSRESLSCLPCLPWKVPEEEIRCREDLRDLCVFTIDPSDASDLDDALSVEYLPDGCFRVGVHIADVSYFVLPDTALDAEARVRSTSVYLLQRKLPMLPPTLSESIGSLTPGSDKLAFSIFWDFNGEGDVIDRRIGRSVIRSCCKLSYDHAQDIVDGLLAVDGGPELHGSFKWSDVVRSVRSLYDISTGLRNRRFRNGALRLESSKPSFLFDESGTPYEFAMPSRKGSNYLVEEFMLLANITAAEIISRAYPESAFFRRHPEPNIRKLKEFEVFCSKHGLDLDITCSGGLHESLEKMREKLKDDTGLMDILINYATRPMQMAAYFCSGDLDENSGEWYHYALGVPLYTHFTSPLRRYPDIVVHRMVAAVLEAEELFCSKTEGSRCFTGMGFDKDAVESREGKEALSMAALKHGVLCGKRVADVAAHCNERKLASRTVRDACDKLYAWFILKKKEVVLSEARVMGLGPRFMSVYISKLGIEKRIYYDEVDMLAAEWLEATSAVILNIVKYKRGGRGSNYYRGMKEVGHVMKPWELSGGEEEVEPVVFPVTLRLFSKIPVALHAVGGDDGPIDIGVRLYLTTYHNII